MCPIKSHACSYLIAIAAILSVFCDGCGGGGSNHDSNMSQAQAQAVTEQVSAAVAGALASAFGAPAGSGVRPSLSTAVRSIRPDQSSGCTPSGSGENCNWPISYDGPCPQGGTIAVTGDIDAMLSGSGGGSVSSQLTITPVVCAVSSLVINGDPNIVLA